jgi:hypothetical protein
MKKRLPILLMILFTIPLLSSFIAVSCKDAKKVKNTPPTLDGQSLVQERCTTCHGLSRIIQARNTDKGWKATVKRMVSKGAQLNATEQEEAVQYLAETYPK